MAMLLALAASPEDLEVILISVTYGNIDVQNCLRNVVSLFHHIEKEIEWRKANGRPIGFEALTKSKPLVAIGPEHPLTDEMLMADFFRTCSHPLFFLRSSMLTFDKTGPMDLEAYLRA
jgi:hypothetical protein